MALVPGQILRKHYQNVKLLGQSGYSLPIPWRWIGVIGALSLVVLILPLPIYASFSSRNSASSPKSVLTTNLTAGVTPTSTSQVTLPSPTPGITHTLTTSSILLQEWSKQIFVGIPSGCENSDTTCWKGSCYRVSKKHHGIIEWGWKISKNPVEKKEVPMMLIGKTEVFIDPGWESPYLVFWNKYRFLGNANIMVKVDRQWQYIKFY